MASLRFPAPILYISSDPSFFGVLDGDKKNTVLKEVTRIDFPIIEKGKINQENLVHALKSLEQKNLYLIVSDEVFRHHISDYALDKKTDIEESIKETVSTVFSEEKEPLHIVTVDLAKTSKLQTVQITALSKENISVIKSAAEETGTQIEIILPASFVVKAFVSVDPSLFLLETTQSFLLTSHYIGVDFAQNIAKNDSAALTKLVREIKKEREHIQHIYICAEEKSVKEIKDSLEDILPVQIVEFGNVDSEADTPFFLKALGIGIKDVIENDFPFPKFSLDEVKVSTPKEEKEAESIDEKVEKIAEKKIAEKPTIKAIEVETEKQEETEEPIADDKTEEKEDVSAIESISLPKPSSIPVPSVKVAEPSTMVTPAPSPITTSVIKPIIQPQAHTPAPTIKMSTPVPESTVSKIAVPSTPTPSAISQSGISSVSSVVQPPKPINTDAPKTTSFPSASVTKPTKKKGGVLRYIFLTIGVAVIISLVGGGVVISQQALKDRKNPPLQTPLTSVTPSEQAQTEPTQTPEPTSEPIDLKKTKVLVVNATTVSGKAGKIAALVKKAGVQKADGTNAKAKYEDGTYIMFEDSSDKAVIEELEKATDLKLEEKEFDKKEDPDGNYDIIIVLAE